MGVQITDIAESRNCELSELMGRKIAIDAYNWAYQFLSIIRNRFTGEPLKDSMGRITSAHSGFFYRTAKLLEAGVTPIYVFDGKPPSFKKRTVDSRKQIREDAREKLEKARREGDREKIRLYAQASSRITEDMIDEIKELVSAMGVGVVQAPSEGEAQMADMVRTSDVWSGASQDWDSLLFGSPRLVRNLSITGKRKLPGKQSYVDVKPEIIELDRVLSSLGVSREQLVIMGILIGTDYNPGGIKGTGPKNALKLVKEKGDLGKVMEDVDWKFDISPEKIYDFFMNPPADRSEIKTNSPDWEKVRGFLIDHDFSENRIDSTLEKMEKAKKKKGSRLDNWLK